MTTDEGLIIQEKMTTPSSLAELRKILSRPYELDFLAIDADGVRVNAMAPGGIESDMLRNALAGDPGALEQNHRPHPHAIFWHGRRHRLGCHLSLLSRH